MAGSVMVELESQDIGGTCYIQIALMQGGHGGGANDGKREPSQWRGEQVMSLAYVPCKEGNMAAAGGGGNGQFKPAQADLAAAGAGPAEAADEAAGWVTWRLLVDG